MRLFLMRHATAAVGPWADADRPLTPTGRNDLAGAVRGMARLAVQPQVVLASPAQRCRDSAAIVAEGLGLPVAVVRSVEALAVGGSPARVLVVLATLAAVQEVLLVGHEPGLVALASMLLAADATVALRWPSAGCACFEVDGPPPQRPAVLQWLLTPQQLQVIAVSKAR